MQSVATRPSLSKANHLLLDLVRFVQQGARLASGCERAVGCGNGGRGNLPRRRRTPLIASFGLENASRLPEQRQAEVPGGRDHRAGDVRLALGLVVQRPVRLEIAHLRIHLRCQAHERS